MATRIGVDVGGTFTDLVFHDRRTGETRVGKGPSTPSRPEQGVLDVVRQSVPASTLTDAEYFLHGTTVGLNALLERKGATVGLLTTEGFRDVLELRRATRGHSMYDIDFVPPSPLVPRRLRLEVSERVLADGVIEKPLDLDSVSRALDVFRDEDVDAIAVCLMNSYAHPQHELEVEATLRQLGFDGSITLSHRVSGEMREFERTATSVVDAYVRPAVSRYLGELGTSLTQQGFGGQCLITRSGGGSISFVEAGERPFETVMSGPVAGAVGAGALARALGLTRAITADVGGTSFDTCLLLDGEPLVKYEGEVGGLPLQTQWVDVRSIGSGGGSIATVEPGGMLHVGPESAGASPGPACYGKGGDRATTTDAAASLGMLAFGELAGGLQLDFDAAHKVIDVVADALSLPRDEAAAGIITIASAAMAGAVRSVTIEQGEDPREAALIAFGGAGPMLATSIASELEISTIVVPEHAGNFSAYSLLDQDITRSASASAICQLDAHGIGLLHARAQSLQRGLLERAAESDETSHDVELLLELRYVGQMYTLTVPWDAPSASSEPADLARVFEAQYLRVFGHTIEGPIEVVAVRATHREPLTTRAESQPPRPVRAPARSCRAHSFDLGERVDFKVVDRADLTLDDVVVGPLIVLEPTTTTYVDAGWTVRIGPRQAMILSRKESR